ncbi:UDP-N-acetylmuramoyl-tripeptide--D-alanyl-D-alanine ligase [Patescibacteria group bacterium]|nr:UDP-N-acetylmuramoyl-tripeptide--D-alanyl-D-alanine ligase [Patescibacteria group bacterium]
MRTLLRNIFIALLAALARGIVRKYQPKVVMITGSVGKTSTKDAVAAALSEKFFVRKNEKSFNSGFGVPFTIIGVKNPWTNLFAWMSVFGEGILVLLFPNHYPKLLVLEVGAEQPGDLAQILKMVKPDAVVVTLLPSVPVHVEAYETPEAVREEEFEPARALVPEAPLIISADDPHALTQASHTETEVYTFGYAEGSMVRITDIGITREEGVPQGMEAQLEIEGKRYNLKVAGAFGRSQLYAPAAAVAAALSLGMSVKEALTGLENYVPPPGRGRLLKGKKNSVLIDDSYNSSPAAVEESLRSLTLLDPKKRKVAILGDMLELGRYSMAEHIRIGHIAKEMVDVLITVGARAQAIGETAREDGMPDERVQHFASSKEAAHAIEGVLEEEDLVLVKGSQSIRLERVLKVLIKDFADQKQLVRQEKEWNRR